MYEMKTTGLNRALKRIDAIDKAFSQGVGVNTMQELGAAGIKDVRTRFETAGYGTWAPLSPITIAKKNGRTEILIDSGKMKESVGIRDVSQGKVTVWVPYATPKQNPKIPRRHQDGVPQANLPQRKIVEVTEHLMTLLRPVINKWTNKLTK